MGLSIGEGTLERYFKEQENALGLKIISKTGFAVDWLLSQAEKTFTEFGNVYSLGF